jgi:phosphotransferase system enzyme I (PtsI)
MQTLQGIAVSPGVAFGEALVIDNEGFRIPRRFVTRDAVDEEIHRLDRAIETVAKEIELNRERVTEQLGDQYGAIFGAHLQMLRDTRLRDELESLIRGRNYSSEYAVSRTLRRYAKVFESLQSSYLAERAHDLFDIEKRLLASLLGHRREAISHLASPVIILAHNLTPSETASLDPLFVKGFVTEVGGAGGHTAIVAEALEIPAVVGTGRFLADVSGGDTVIVDGDLGRIILQPDEKTLQRYQAEAEEHRVLAHSLASLHELPAETTDGERIGLHANIEFPHEAEACLKRGADGVGLYRTEFLYLGTEGDPSEEVHYKAYAKVVRAMQGRPVVIRTLDLGADKIGRMPDVELERNPFLGVRSIRLSLRNLPVFRTQLRAVLRASALGDVRLMFPLISTIEELRQVKMVLAELMEDLDEAGIPFNRNVPLGIMVEVPAVVVMIDRFLPEVDFISIGTNDLIQYALAVDRGNNEVAELYRASHPAVLKLLKMSIDAAAAAGVPASACGQMSGMPAFAMLLLGMGLRSMSVPPAAITEIKKVIRSVSLQQCRSVAERALTMDTAREIDVFLREELKKIVPELVLN